MLFARLLLFLEDILFKVYIAEEKLDQFHQCAKASVNCMNLVRCLWIPFDTLILNGELRRSIYNNLCNNQCDRQLCCKKN